MKTKTKAPFPSDTIGLNINFNQAESNGLNIKINYVDVDIPNSISITLAGEHHAPLPTLNHNQCNKLHSDFDLSDETIDKLDQKITHLMTTTIIKQRLKNCI